MSAVKSSTNASASMKNEESQVPSGSSQYHSLPESGEAGGVGLSLKDVENPTSSMEAFEQEISHKRGFRRFRMTDAQIKIITKALYMSVFAVFGALLRIILAQLFGEECKNPGTVGWLAAASPLCVTADGEVGEVNGIVFADFPSNMLGSFIMGLMVSADTIGLPVSAPVAWLSPENVFQKYDVLHLAIRTGFCGSLTTFSSWNSDMVVMIYATGAGSRHSNWLRALIGYAIGMETALGSFIFGRTVALWIHRFNNPIMSKEEDAVIERKAQGVYINNKLPTFERRFLPDFSMELEPVEPHQLELLERWRLSTKEARRVGHWLLPTLIDIEDCILIQRQPATPLLREDAAEAGWDVDAVEEWVRLRDADKPVLIQPEMPDSFLSWKPAAVLFCVVFTLIAIGFTFIDGQDSYSLTYHTMLCAGLFAAPGALLRWALSNWNGKIPGERLGWLPFGTFTANVVGSFLSIAAIAAELRLEQRASNYGVQPGFGVIGVVRAIKVGFAGSLTTVSSFVAEVAKFMQCSKQQYRAYLYILMTIGTSCIVSVVVYGLILYAF